MVFLMTAGGPPLLSGITDRYIIGATTTLDVFLYDVFGTTDDLGITSAYSVLMAGIVVLLMLIWYVAREDRIGAVKKYRVICGVTVVIQLLFSGTAGILPAIGYLGGVINRRVLKISAAAHAVWIVYRISTAGFLEGFTPGILPALFTIWFFRESRMKGLQTRSAAGQRDVQLKLRRIPVSSPGPVLRPRLADGLSSGMSVLTGGFMLVASAVIVYFLLWMSFSGVSACFIDGFLPPHAGLGSYAAAIIDENILLYFRNTILVAGITGAVISLISLPAAMYMTSKGRAFTAGFLTFIQAPRNYRRHALPDSTLFDFQQSRHGQLIFSADNYLALPRTAFCAFYNDGLAGKAALRVSGHCNA